MFENDLIQGTQHLTKFSDVTFWKIQFDIMVKY